MGRRSVLHKVHGMMGLVSKLSKRSLLQFIEIHPSDELCRVYWCFPLLLGLHVIY